MNNLTDVAIDNNETNIFDIIEKIKNSSSTMDDFEDLMNVLNALHELSDYYPEVKNLTIFLDNLIYTMDKSLRIFYIFSITGLLLSGFGLIILFTTACLFQKWAKKYQNQILIHFTVARFMNSFFGIIEAPNGLEAIKENHIANILNKYFQIVVTMWILFFMKHLHELLVIIIRVKGNHKLLKQSLWAWLTPVLPTLLHGLAIYYFNFSKYIVLILSNIFTWSIMLLNGVLYIKIVRSVLINFNNKQRKKRSKIRTVIIFVVLFTVINLQNVGTSRFKYVCEFNNK